jgi:hypothetical protein
MGYFTFLVVSDVLIRLDTNTGQGWRLIGGSWAAIAEEESKHVAKRR